MNKFMEKVFKEVDSKELTSNVSYSSHLHQALSTYIEALKTSETIVLSQAFAEVIMVLNRLSFYHFCKVMQDIDTKYPGLSFHFVMEARQTSNNSEVKSYSNKIEILNLTRYQNIVYLPTDNEKAIDKNILPSKEAHDFLHRLKFLKDINCLNHVFAPMRTRLIVGILEEDEKTHTDIAPVISPEKAALSNYFRWVNKEKNISNEFKGETEDTINMYLARDIIENYQPTVPAVWTEEQFMSFIKDSIIYKSVQV